MQPNPSNFIDIPSPHVIYVYDDTGVSEESLQNTLFTFHKLFGNTLIKTINAKEVCAGTWTQNATLFVMPGGADLPYAKKLNGAGNQIIKNFIENGGAYIGICAGAYYGSSYVEFAKAGPLEVIGTRELSFFPGKAIGPVLATEVFQLVGSQKYLFLDIKSSKILDNNFVDKIVALIHSYHLQETVVVESFNPIFLTSMRLSARDILLMYDFTTSDTIAIGEETQAQFDKIPWLLKQQFFQKQVRRIVRPDILGPRWNVDTNLLKALIANNYPVISWTIDDVNTAAQLFKLGVKGLQTNKPIELMQDTAQTEQTIYDAGGTEIKVDKVIHVKNTQDIINAINEAKKTKKTITIAGRRHSMGGKLF